ncbi:MAG: hypothetical protein ICV66_13665 [Chitinophagaceae bacterium]|nr:hypothetical protein [Chitinophagaceae bacterium]
MKRLSSILLFCLLLFNLFGYRIFLDYVQNQQDQRLKSQISNEEYNYNDLISIKIPYTLPYNNSSKEYEPITGSVEIKGIEYKYVKRRLYRDSIELLCLPNTGKQKIQKVKNDFFNWNHNGPTPEQNKRATALKILFPEFDHHFTGYSLQDLNLNPAIQFSFSDKIFPSAYIFVQEQPPESMQS